MKFKIPVEIRKNSLIIPKKFYSVKFPKEIDISGKKYKVKAIG